MPLENNGKYNIQNYFRITESEKDNPMKSDWPHNLKKEVNEEVKEVKAEVKEETEKSES